MLQSICMNNRSPHNTKPATLASIALTASLVVFLLCGTCFAAVNDIGAEQAVRNTLQKFSDYYVKKHLDGVMSLYANRPDIIAIASHKEFIGPQQIKGLYAQAFQTVQKINNIDYKIIFLNVSGDIAWLAADGFTGIGEPGKEIGVYGRLTAVLQKTQEGWQFVQTHFSFPTFIPGMPAVQPKK